MDRPGPRPWTTTRCNRLLRPIVNKLEMLHVIADSQRGKTISISQASYSTNSNFNSADDEADQPDQSASGTRELPWTNRFENTNRRTCQRTYGGRHRKRQYSETSQIDEVKRKKLVHQPGAIIVTTPIIARTSGDIHLSPIVPDTDRREIIQRTTAERSRLRKLTRFNQSDAFNGLSSAYEALLQATRTPRQPTDVGGEVRKGCRSLLSMCLRKVPAYIQEEELLDADTPEHECDTRASSMVYDYLQGMGCAVDEGWPHLREVVRAHGTLLVTDAIAAGAIGGDKVSMLMLDVIRVDGFDEADQILSSFAAVAGRISPPCSVYDDAYLWHTSPHLYLLRRLAAYSSFACLFRHLRNLLLSGELPIYWLATTPFQRTWQRAIKSVANRASDSGDAASFIEAALLSSCGLNTESEDSCFRAEAAHIGEQTRTNESAAQLPDKSRPEVSMALQNTISTLCALLCSLSLTERRTDSSSMHELNNNIPVRLIRNACLELQRPMNTLGRRSVCSTFAEFQRAMTVLTADLVLSANCLTADSRSFEIAIDNFLRTMTWLTNQLIPRVVDFPNPFESIPNLIYLVACSCGRTTGDRGFRILQTTVRAILDGSVQVSQHDQKDLWVLKKMSLDAALEFGLHSTSSQHNKFATAVESEVREVTRLSKGKRPVITPDKSSKATFGGYRWEAGICEWIVATPLKKGRSTWAWQHLPNGKGNASDEANGDPEGVSAGDSADENRGPDRARNMKVTKAHQAHRSNLSSSPDTLTGGLEYLPAGRRPEKQALQEITNMAGQRRLGVARQKVGAVRRLGVDIDGDDELSLG